MEWVKEKLTSLLPAGGSINDVEISSVQEFRPTAPGPGSNVSDILILNCPRQLTIHEAPWYTNPQTEAFCNLIGVENKVNPPPPGPR